MKKSKERFIWDWSYRKTQRRPICDVKSLKPGNISQPNTSHSQEPRGKWWWVIVSYDCGWDQCNQYFWAEILARSPDKHPPPPLRHRGHYHTVHCSMFAGNGSLINILISSYLLVWFVTFTETWLLETSLGPLTHLQESFSTSAVQKPRWAPRPSTCTSSLSDVSCAVNFLTWWMPGFRLSRRPVSLTGEKPWSWSWIQRSWVKREPSLWKSGTGTWLARMTF